MQKPTIVAKLARTRVSPIEADLRTSGLASAFPGRSRIHGAAIGLSGRLARGSIMGLRNRTGAAWQRGERALSIAQRLMKCNRVLMKPVLFNRPINGLHQKFVLLFVLFLR